MKIIIDGDSCNVIKTTETIAGKNNIECHIYCDTARIIKSDYSRIHIVSKGPNSADFAIVNACEENDLVITNDSGLAALILAKKGFVLNTHGVEYTNDNIMSFLNRRYVREDAKRKTKRAQIKGYSMCDRNRKHADYKKTLKRIIRQRTERII